MEKRKIIRRAAGATLVGRGGLIQVRAARTVVPGGKAQTHLSDEVAVATAAQIPSHPLDMC